MFASYINKSILIPSEQANKFDDLIREVNCNGITFKWMAKTDEITRKEKKNRFA